MPGSRRLSAAELEDLQFVRWMLLLLNASEAAGLGELSRPRLHSLLFLSFSTAKLYGFKPLRQRAQRTDAGPYYRAAHFALGKLALGGLVEVRDFVPHSGLGLLQFEGLCRIGLPGLAVSKVLRETRVGSQIFAFLLDLCLSTAQVVDDFGEEPLDASLKQDLTYQEAVRSSSPVVSADHANGATWRGLRVIRRRLKQRASVNRRDTLVAYQQTLARRVS